MNEPSTRGRVVTFYSYAAGAGQSMTLANVAVLLRKWGHSVLLVDWNLAAPGLERFLLPESRTGRSPLADARKRSAGIVDMLDGFARERPLPWREGLMRTTVPGCGPVAILGAGRDDAGYAAKVRGLDWPRLLGERGLLNYLEGLRAEWTREFQFVLIDGPGGIAEPALTCTHGISDSVVALITANEASLQGTLSIIDQSSHAVAGEGEGARRPRPRVVPVLARDESASEREQALQWRGRVAEEVAGACRSWLPPGVSVPSVLEQLKLPYKPYWSFGRRLPVLLEGTADPGSLGHAYQRLARLVASDLHWPGAADVELRMQNAEQELRETRAALARAQGRLQNLAARAGALLVMGMALVLAGQQWRASTAQRARVDALIEAAGSDDNPQRASLLWREVARLDPDRPLSQVLGGDAALAWPLRAFAVDARLSAVALGPDASSVAFATRDGVFVRSFERDAVAERLPGPRARHERLRFSRDGRKLLALQAIGSPSVWNLDERKALPAPALPQDSTFTADDSGVLGMAGDLESASAWRLDAADTKPAPITQLPDVTQASLIAIGPDGSSFLGMGSLGQREVLLSGTLAADGASANVTGSVDVDCAVQAAAIAKSTLAYQCALQGDLVLRPLPRGQARRVRLPRGLQGPEIEQLRFSLDGRALIALHRDGTASACDVAEGRCAALREHEPIAHVALAPDGGAAATATVRGTVRVWRLGLGPRGPRDWADLMAGLRRDVHGCLPARERLLWLDEELTDARAAEARCLRGNGVRAEVAGGVQTARSSLVGATPAQAIVQRERPGEGRHSAQTLPAAEKGAASAGVVRAGGERLEAPGRAPLVSPRSQAPATLRAAGAGGLRDAEAIYGALRARSQAVADAAGEAELEAPDPESSGIVHVPIGLVIDSEGGHMLFPLALRGGGGISETYRIVAGRAEIVEFGGAGSFLQQAPTATTLVASARAQAAAGAAVLTSEAATALPWLAVDSKRTRSGDEWLTARPYLRVAQVFHWDASRDIHVGQLELGLVAEAGRPAPLADALSLRFSSNCEVSPERVELRELGASGGRVVNVACSRKAKNSRHGPWFGIRATGGALDYALPIPRRPGPVELVSSSRDVLGLGLGALQLTLVHLEEDRTPAPVAADKPVQLKVRGGVLEPKELVIPVGQASISPVLRGRGLGTLHISATAGSLESNTVSVRLGSPVLFLGITLLGGAVGGYLAARLLRPHRSGRARGFRSVSLGILAGAVVGVSCMAITLAFRFGPLAMHDSALAWLIGALLSGTAGALLVRVVSDQLANRRETAAPVREQGAELQS